MENNQLFWLMLFNTITQALEKLYICYISNKKRCTAFPEL